MKNYFVIISIMIIFLIPLNVGASPNEPLPGDFPLDEQPYASTYVTLRNSNGELVGQIHFNDKLMEDASDVPSGSVLSWFEDTFGILASKTITINEVQYRMTDPIQTGEIIDADCNNASQKAMGYGNIYDTCFFYTFRTGFFAIVEVDNEVTRSTTFDSLHHGFIVEGGDTVKINWTFLIPTN